MQLWRMRVLLLALLALLAGPVADALRAAPVHRRVVAALFEAPAGRTTPSVVGRAGFAAAELFGRAVDLVRRRPPADPSVVNDETKEIEPEEPLSVASVSKKIVSEYERLFWITGTMDVSLWEDDCTFADPFSSFGGPGSTKRFKKNSDALGSLVENSSGKVTSVKLDKCAESGQDVVRVGWVFSGSLKLPWRPILAAAGETSHFLSPTTLKITRYQERWKSEPWDVVKRLFVPGSK